MALLANTSWTTFRRAIIAEVKRSIGVACIALEPVDQDARRPKLPYFTCKFTGPASRRGFPDLRWVSESTFNYGLQLSTTVSFNCYATTQEQAYELMYLWNQALQLETVRQRLIVDGLAVWSPGDVADLSALLDTGYEGRSQMDVVFGFASNITDDLGLIEHAAVTGTVDTNDGQTTVVFDAPED